MMREVCYGKEPFDLRLTVLRLFKRLPQILLLTLLGTFLFGGGYYVNKVLLVPEPSYTVTSTYKIDYVESPVQSGDYYINEMTWNTLVQSTDFLTGVQTSLRELAALKGMEAVEMSMEELGGAISAKLPSDWNIPTTTVVAGEQGLTLLIAAAVEDAMGRLPEMLREVEAVRVITPAAEAEEVLQDVRPIRALVLSALLTFFFVTVFFLLKELGDDSIWLPVTLAYRYGLPYLGTINSPELLQNITYMFKGRKHIAVCSVDATVDTKAVADAIDKKVKPYQAGVREWTALPSPLMCPETCEVLRSMDAMLLVVPAGSHVGKPLEYTLAFLSQQDCSVGAALLWDADEGLIRGYYRFAGDRNWQ